MRQTVWFPNALSRRFLTFSLLTCLLSLTALADSHPLDGSWTFQSSSRKGNTSRLPEGDTLILKILGTKGEITINPGNPGVVETLIKQFCNRLYGEGKITYVSKPPVAKFDVFEVRGELNSGFCPASKVLGELAGRDIAEKLERGNLKFDFSYQTSGNRLVLTTVHKNETVAFTFKREP